MLPPPHFNVRLMVDMEVGWLVHLIWQEISRLCALRGERRGRLMGQTCIEIEAQRNV